MAINRLTLFVILITGLMLIIPATAQDSQSVFSELPPGEWSQINIEDGICLYGTAYSFFVRPNETPTDNLMIYFQGGGACQDGLTCGTVGGYATVYDVYEDRINLYEQGVFSFDNDLNPLDDYNVVFLPYCSGDFHTGSTQMTLDVPPEANYDEPQIEVFFNGFDNSQRVLDWVYQNFERPDRLLITGCSAGGYGALHHAPFILEQYPDATTTVISDAAMGIQGKNWDALNVWGTLDNMPDFMPELAEITAEDYSTTYHMEALARAYPQTSFAQYSSYLDDIQVSFFLSSGGRDIAEGAASDYFSISAPWSAELLDSTRRLAELPNYHYYIAGGALHCIINNDFFYFYNEADTPFFRWYEDVMFRRAQNVACVLEDNTCFLQPLGR